MTRQALKSDFETDVLLESLIPSTCTPRAAPSEQG
jgi:hypothetical protein